MRLVRAGFALLGLALALLIAFAMATGDFWAAGKWLTSDPWGMVTLADLYLGLCVSALVIALFERSPAALFWILPLPLLGNVWTAVWLIVRFPALCRRMNTADAG